MQKSNIEEIHQLANTQKALLINYLRDEEDQGLIQVRCILEGSIDSKLFQKAWETLIENHKALRTSIFWKNISKPIQIVAKTINMNWYENNFSLDSKDTQEQQIKSYLEEDKKKGIRLEDSPNWRIAFFKLAENRYLFVWTCHHILIDGWSSSIAINQAINFYQSYLNDKEIVPNEVPSYFDYLKWVKKADKTPIKKFWQESLSGFDHPTLVDKAKNNRKKEAVIVSSRLEQKTSRQLRKIAKNHGVSLSILFQSIWTILLSKLLCRTDIVFGVTYSGRSGAEISNIDQSVGMFANTLPFRIQLNYNKSFIHLLQSVQQTQSNLNQVDFVDYSGLLSEESNSMPAALFDTLFVFENFLNQSNEIGQVFVNEFESGITSNYPLTITIIPKDEIEIAIIYSFPTISKDLANQLLSKMSLVADEIIQNEYDSSLSFTDHIFFNEAEKKELKTSEGLIEEDTPKNVRKKKPRTELEFRILEIFKTVLGLKTIGIDENFFELGGTSIQALHIFDQINSQINVDLSIVMLMNFPTVEKLAKEIENSSNKKTSCIVKLKEGRSSDSIYCLHTHSGDLLLYKDFVDSISSDYSVFGIQYDNTGDSVIKEGSIEELAEKYVNEIKKNQPNGSYSVISYCFSGSLAIVIGQKLRERSEKVCSITLIDPGIIGIEVIHITLHEKLKIFFRWLFLGYFNHLFWYTTHYFVDKISNRNREQEPHTESNIEKSLRNMFAQFSLKKCDLLINYIRSNDIKELPKNLKTFYSWKVFLKDNMELYIVNASHVEIMKKPYIEQVAKIIEGKIASCNKSNSK